MKFLQSPQTTNAFGTLAVAAYGVTVGLVVYNIMATKMFADFTLGRHISFALAVGFPLALVFSTRMFQQFVENILALRSIPAEEDEARHIEVGVNWAGAGISSLLVCTLVWFSVSMLRLQVQVVRDGNEIDYLSLPEVKTSQESLARAQHAYNTVLADTRDLDAALEQVKSAESSLKSLGSAKRNFNSEDPNTQYLIAASLSTESRSRNSAVTSHSRASEHLKAVTQKREQRVSQAKQVYDRASMSYDSTLAAARKQYGGLSMIELAEQESGVSGISMVAYLPESASIVITLLLGFAMIMERGKLSPRRILVRKPVTQSVEKAAPKVSNLTREQRVIIQALKQGADSLGKIEKATTHAGLRIPKSTARLLIRNMQFSKHPEITAIRHLLPRQHNGTS